MKKKVLLNIIIFIILSLLISACATEAKMEDTDNISILDVTKIKETPIVIEKVAEEVIEEVEEDIKEEISILAVGDIMFHIPQVKAAYLGDGKYDFRQTYKYVKKHIDGADVSLANFETVTAGNHIPYSGFPRFNSPKETLLALADTGFDIISTANNHSLDKGKKGILSTLDNIEEYGMKALGTNRTNEPNILIQEVKGIKIGFLSYTYGLNGLDSLLSKEELSYMVNIIDEERIEKDIKKTKEMGVDLTVLFLHWGHEYHTIPSDYQVELGEKIIEWGGNIIFGSHPHVIQKSEIIYNKKDNFIIYSMGNFLSNQSLETMDNSLTQDGIMVKINIEKNFTKNQVVLKDIEYIPTWVYRYKSEGRFYYEILPVEEIINGELEIDISEQVYNMIEKSFSNTMSTIK